MSDGYKACPFAKELRVQGTTGEPSKTVGWICSAVCDKCPARNPLRHGYNSVFNQITQSPEVLAEKFVYFAMSDEYGRDYWGSSLLDGLFWKTEKEAVAATVAKLKEVCDE